MLKYMTYAALALMAATPLAAQGFKAQNGVQVVTSGKGFTVKGGNGFGARGQWCAAADYARSAAGASTSQRLYVVGSSSNRNVTFTLNKSGLTPSSVSSLGASVNQPGANLTVGHALGFCADRKLVSGRS